MKFNIILDIIIKNMNQNCEIKNSIFMLNKYYHNLLYNKNCKKFKINDKIFCKTHDELFIYIYTKYHRLNFLNVYFHNSKFNPLIQNLYIHENSFIKSNLIKEFFIKNNIKIIDTCCNGLGIIVSFQECKSLFKTYF